MDSNVVTFIGCDSSFFDAKTVLFGAPFDSTTSYRPGTRFASRTIRAESEGLETYSPYLDKDLTDIRVFDAGDLELCFGNTEKALHDIEDMAAAIITEDKIPCMIGGEHLVTLGAVRALYAKYPDLHLIHFDAHTDLREDYLGEPLSHATVMRRVWDMLGDGRLNQFGIRSGERSEFAWAKKHSYLHPFDFETLEMRVQALSNVPVYFSLDLDVLDPSVFPGTGTPEPGGVTFDELRQACMLLRGLNIVGFDVCELSPHYDPSGASTAVACKIIRELLLAFY